MFRASIKNIIRNQASVKRLPRAFTAAAAAVPLRPLQHFKVETLVELQAKATEAYTTNPMFGTKVGNAFEWITYEQFDKEVAKFRIVLNQHKIGFDDKVALISNNRVEWAIVNYAAAGLGAQIVPMYVLIQFNAIK
jgi:long-subunit acyl-CoA synthetase (AMP-forming)